MNYYGDVVATTGTYKAKDGTERKNFVKCGAAFVGENDKGEKRMSIKLDCVPVDKEWSSWLSIYPRKPKDNEAEYNASRQPSDTKTESQAESIIDEGEPVNFDDIPF